MLAEFGLDVPEEVEIRVWDSSADLRYIVLPMRPEGTDGMSEEELADTRDARLHDRRRSAAGRGGGGVIDREADEPFTDHGRRGRSRWRSSQPSGWASTGTSSATA